MRFRRRSSFRRPRRRVGGGRRRRSFGRRRGGLRPLRIGYRMQLVLCKKPFHNFACGQCNPCRFNRRRLWSHRMMLESLKHAENSFLTLTYDAEHLPAGGTLVPRDVQLFLKRLRKAISPVALRYFFVGEYGDQTFRPHYHAALFGLGIGATDVVKKSWGFGHVMLGDLTLHSAQYIAGYVVKKMTSDTDRRLDGRHPEFARMSLRPGIGAPAVGDVAVALKNQYGINFILDSGDVPVSLKSAKKNMPLGRYIRSKLRAELGLTDALKDKDAQIYRSQKMSALYPTLAPDTKAQKILNFETRTKIYTVKGKL